MVGRTGKLCEEANRKYPWGIEWEHDQWRHVTPKSRVVTPRPLSRAAVTNSAGCSQIRLAAAPIISGGGGVAAAPAFRTNSGQMDDPVKWEREKNIG